MYSTTLTIQKGRGVIISSPVAQEKSTLTSYQKVVKIESSLMRSINQCRYMNVKVMIVTITHVTAYTSQHWTEERKHEAVTNNFYNVRGANSTYRDGKLPRI